MTLYQDAFYTISDQPSSNCQGHEKQEYSETFWFTLICLKQRNRKKWKRKIKKKISNQFTNKRCVLLFFLKRKERRKHSQSYIYKNQFKIALQTSKYSSLNNQLLVSNCSLLSGPVVKHEYDQRIKVKGI